MNSFLDLVRLNVLLVESTANCIRTRFLVLALEESGQSYELVHLPEGHFQRTERGSGGGVGPVMVDGECRFSELNVALLHLGRLSEALLPRDARRRIEVETWLELQASWLRPAALRIHAALLRDVRDEDAEHTLMRCLGRYEAALGAAEYLAGTFSLADCTAPFLMAAREAGLPFNAYPALLAYLARVEARPSWGRVRKRLQSQASD